MALAESAAPASDIDALYRRHRLRVMLAITLGYGFIYTCRLGLSIVKKPLIDGGIFSVEDLGMIGAALFYGYAFGKFFNGFFADHFRPRLFFSLSIFISALINLLMGWSTLVWISIVLWALNGWFQGMAAPSAIITITNWFSIRERGGTKGIAVVSKRNDCDGPSSTYKGQNPTSENKLWESSVGAGEGDPYFNEWVALLDAIRNDKPHNEVKRGV
jgi:sugar phosphate permease